MAEGTAVVGMDARGVVTHFDEGAEMLFGYASADAVGRSVAELIVPPELRAVHQRGLERVASGGPSALVGTTIEVPALDAYGRRLQVELSISHAAPEDAASRFIGTIGVVRAHSSTDRPSSAER